MDGGAPKPSAGDGKRRAVPRVPTGSDAVARAGAARVPRRAAFPEDAAADAAAARGAGTGGGEEEEDDVQVERFYALLDNIRAMRGAYGGAGDGDGTGAEGVETGGGGARKRLRAADPPWRPAFRMEDFEEPSPTSSPDAAAAARHAKKTPMRQEEADAEEGGAHPAAASASATASPPHPPRAGVRLDSGRKSI